MVRKGTALLGALLVTGTILWVTPNQVQAAPQDKSVVTVTASSVFVSKVHGEGDVLTEALQGASFEITEDFGDGWIQVQIGSETGYMRKDDGVSISGESEEVVDGEETGLEETGPAQELQDNGEVSEVRQNLVNFAMQFLGGPYSYGGNDPHTGVDCSGFTRYVLQHGAGVSLGRSSRNQATQGIQVSAEQMRPGDLVFYASRGRINHVAMYIGDGQVIHASTYKTGIKLSPWTYRTPVKIMNVIGD